MDYVLVAIVLSLELFLSHVGISQNLNLKNEIDNLNAKTEIILNANIPVEDTNKSEILEVNSDTFEKEVLKSDRKVLVYFYMTWCKPCQELAPIIEELAKENTDIKVVKIDVEKNRELAKQYNVEGSPTLIVIEDGEIKNRDIGVKDKEYIQNMIYGEV